MVLKIVFGVCLTTRVCGSGLISGWRVHIHRSDIVIFMKTLKVNTDIKLVCFTSL